MDGLLATSELVSMARVALWEGDARAAAETLATIDASGLHAPTVEARRLVIRAGLAAHAGRPEEAKGLYRDALARWRSLGYAFDEALVGLDMAILFDPGDLVDPEVVTITRAAREILVRLRARPFIDRLDAAMARGDIAGVPAQS
jgi:hypothetical protein